MLEYARIHVSEEIDANKSTMSREFIICHYQYVFDINFRFQPKVCDGYHDLMQKATSFDDVVIVISVKENDHRIYFLQMSEDKAINLLRNADLTEKSGAL